MEVCDKIRWRLRMRRLGALSLEIREVNVQGGVFNPAASLAAFFWATVPQRFLCRGCCQEGCVVPVWVVFAWMCALVFVERSCLEAYRPSGPAKSWVYLL